MTKELSSEHVLQFMPLMRVRLVSLGNLMGGIMMRTTWKKIDKSGVWSITIPWNLEWAAYKYCIDTGSSLLYKADPYATFAEEKAKYSLKSL